QIVLKKALRQQSDYFPSELENLPLLIPVDRTITGKVTDATSREPLPGVNIMVKGTQSGTVTGIDGSFSLSVREGSDVTLVFSFVGYITQEVELGNRTSLEVSLAVDEKALEEVVVV